VPPRRAWWWRLRWACLLYEEIGGHLPYCCCTNSPRVHRGLLAGGKNTPVKYMEGGVYYGEFSLLLLLEGDEWGAQVRMDISPIGFMDSWTCNLLLRWS
jgi:hypothetical protein